ncbi:MAG: hypothetical protein HY727_09495 [Candidatus Rokubacteria bacterium]|nr:hypothetical protein [Candidatus Rokubacteria bacterium]
MRLRRWTIAASLASLPFVLPHVVEDFAEGTAQRFGLSTAAGAFLLGGFLALQSLGLILVGLRRREGFRITLWVGVIWVVGAVTDHGPAIVGGGFRSGAPSVLWVLGLVATQATAALLAWQGGRRLRK